MIVTSEARISRSTSSIAATSRARCDCSSGSSIDAARPSESRSSAALRLAVRRQPGAAHAAVGAAVLDHDQPFRFQRAQQPARVAGVESQPPAQVTDVGAVGTDLPQQARLAQRPAAVEVALVQGAHPLRDGAVEAAHARDRLGVHCLTLVKECCVVKPA